VTQVTGRQKMKKTPIMLGWVSRKGTDECISRTTCDSTHQNAPHLQIMATLDRGPSHTKQGTASQTAQERKGADRYLLQGKRPGAIGKTRGPSWALHEDDKYRAEGPKKKKKTQGASSLPKKLCRTGTTDRVSGSRRTGDYDKR